MQTAPMCSYGILFVDQEHFLPQSSNNEIHEYCCVLKIFRFTDFEKKKKRHAVSAVCGMCKYGWCAYVIWID